jgi:hypothetical protein
MALAYWIACYRSVSNWNIGGLRQARGPRSLRGTFSRAGNAARTRRELTERVVVIEFDSVSAVAAHDAKAIRLH